MMMVLMSSPPFPHVIKWVYNSNWFVISKNNFTIHWYVEVINILDGYNASRHQRPSHLITATSKNMFISHVVRVLWEG